jgi:hypothetical protein
MVSLNSVGLTVLYGIGLIIAFNLGKRHSKERYSKLVRRLHLNYRNEKLATKSFLLSGIPDIEEYLYQKKKRATKKTETLEARLV